jgi:phenylacetate-coenzyme A ligase PaaK-like adenylate-forming protein
MELSEAFRLSRGYNRMKAAERDALRDRRLRDLVGHVRANSPYFGERYAGIGEDFSLSDLPVTTKTEMTANFDDWVTDRDLRLADIRAYMENKDNIGRKYLDRYYLLVTSGSTGNPAVVVRDKTTQNVTDATDLVRCFARKRDELKYFMHGWRMAGVYTKGDFYMGSAMIRARHFADPKSQKLSYCADILDPLPKTVEGLNRFNPGLLSTYPTVLTLLAEEQIAKRLRISPAVILSSGEKLTSEARELIASVFKCSVQDNYYCTEGGALASECTHRHVHVNDDWIIVEPVDERYNPVPSGQLASRWLMTGLHSYTQPFIRYEITDRIVLHNEGCPCGRISPWIEIDGRANDLLLFTGKEGEEVRIAPMTFSVLKSEIRNIGRYQVVIHKGNRVELRLETDDKTAIFEQADALIRAFLAKNGVSAEAVLSDSPPRYDPSGKFRQYYMAD